MELEVENEYNKDEISPVKKENLPPCKGLGVNCDQIIAIIGETGKWQLERISIVFIVSIPGLAHIFMSPFSMPKTEFWCNDTSVTNLTKNVCSQLCSNYEYDKSFWDETTISQYDLVCEREYLSTFAKSLFFAGFGIGTFLAGIVSDTYGRKKAIICFSGILLVSGLLCSFMPNYPAFLSLWIVVGIAACANYTVAFVWVMELASGKWKIILGMGMQFTWPISRMVVALAAWSFRNWRHIMQAISAPMLIAPVLLYFLPESPRWLVAKNMTDRAKVILGEIVARNKMSVDTENITLKKPDEMQTRKGTVLDLLRYPVLRQKTFIMYFNWFASSFMMYGLALNWQNLTGNLFFTFLVAALLDFPAKGFAVVSLFFYGRKLPYVGLTFIAGLLFVVILFIPRGMFDNELPIVIVSLIASFCVSSSFSMLWMWMSELMPTTVRNAGVGSSSMIARIGGVLATTVGKLADIDPCIPIAMFAASALISAIISLLLPETQGKKLPDTAEESEEVRLCGPIEGFTSMFLYLKTRRAE